MTIQELEKKVWDQDHVRIVVRECSTARVGKYIQKTAAKENWRVTQFLKKRIDPLVKEKQVVVLDGTGKIPNGNTLLKALRQSYN